MAEPMNIWQLEEYAKSNNGWKSGHFVCVNEKGLFEFKWLDAYCGLIEPVQEKKAERHFIKSDQLRKFFGDDQKYIPTIGYDTEE